MSRQKNIVSLSRDGIAEGETPPDDRRGKGARLGVSGAGSHRPARHPACPARSQRIPQEKGAQPVSPAGGGGRLSARAPPE